MLWKKKGRGADKDPNMALGVRLAIAGTVGLGALVSGFLLSRGGRRVVSDAFHGRRRSPLTDRVLETLWSDPALGRRDLDVEEIDDGTVILMGAVATEHEQRRARELAASVRGVNDVDERLAIDPSLRGRRVPEEIY